MALVVAVSLWAGTATAAPPRTVRLRNDLSPGVLSVYSLSAKFKRVTLDEAGAPSEVLTYEQPARLTIYGLAPPRGGKADRVWMLEQDEARVDELLRQGQAVRPLPEAYELGLPRRAAQLRVDRASTRHAFAAVGSGSPIQRSALLLALDVTHWPADRVGPGASWEHLIEQEFFAGQRAYTLTSVEGRGRQRTATVVSEVTGQFRDTLRDRAVLQEARTRCVWHLSEHAPTTLQATVTLQYTLQRAPRRLELELSLERVDRRKLPAEERTATADQLAKLTEATEIYQRGDRAQAVEVLRRFEPTYPHSIWLPVVRDLLAKAKYEGEQLESLDVDQLASVLVQLITRWQTIAVTDRPEQLAPLRRTFGELVRIKRELLGQLAGGNDTSLRAIAVFCFAFGPLESDRRMLVKACSDPRAQVRAWAVYGLAEQRRADTDAVLLEGVLADNDARVRQRACMAIAACVEPGSTLGGHFADLLLDAVRSDLQEDVRALAASALMRLAQPRQKSSLIAIRAGEAAESVIERLDRVIERLEGEKRG